MTGRKIVLGEFVGEVNGKETPYKTAELLEQLLMFPPRGGGIDVKDLKQRVRLTDLLEEAESELILDQKDYDYVLSLMNTFTFTHSNRAVLQMLLNIEEAEEIELAEKE